MTFLNRMFLALRRILLRASMRSTFSRGCFPNIDKLVFTAYGINQSMPAETTQL